MEKIDKNFEIECSLDESSNKCLAPSRGGWTFNQDNKLLEWVKIHGPKNWKGCSEYVKSRTAKQCRDRWSNYLNPNLISNKWSFEEDYIMLKLIIIFGNKWSLFTKYLVGRSTNSIKNRFYGIMKQSEEFKNYEVFRELRGQIKEKNNQLLKNICIKQSMLIEETLSILTDQAKRDNLY